MARQDKIGKHATHVEKVGNETRVVYHSTTVVRIFGSGSFSLHSGGYRTVTTKLRMNQASQEFGLGFKVYQHNGEWYVTTHDGKTYTFQDGMVLPQPQ